MRTGWSEFDAAVHVLRDPLIAAHTGQFISFTPPGIRFDLLLEDSMRWSHGERLLVLAALDLWNGGAQQLGEPYGWRELANTLAFEHVERVFDAVRILCGHPVWA